MIYHIRDGTEPAGVVMNSQTNTICFPETCKTRTNYKAVHCKAKNNLQKANMAKIQVIECDIFLRDRV
jgi:hypothetical protein